MMEEVLICFSVKANSNEFAFLFATKNTWIFWPTKNVDTIRFLCYDKNENII